MNDDSKPISAFDEMCRVTILTMESMDMETLLRLKKQATREFNRAKLIMDCIKTALSLREEAVDSAAQEADTAQGSLLD